MKRCATARYRASVSVHVLESRIVMSAAFDQTGLTDLRLDPTFFGIDGSGVGVAVLDTGIFANHPQLRQNVVAYYNAVNSPLPNAIDGTSVQFARDIVGHGTHVSGTVGSTDPEVGVAPGAQIVAVKVLADPAEPQIGGDPVLRGLQFVERFADQFNIKVVNMSLGYITQTGGLNLNVVPDPDAFSRQIDTLEAMGITVVASSGNSYANDPVPGAGFPAVVSTISVASTWSTTGLGHDFTGISGGPTDQFFAFERSALPDRFSATSQRSTLGNQLAAPGVDIFSTWNGASQPFNTISGTSMAAPYVSGLVALVQEAALTFGGQYFSDVQDVFDILADTADPVVDTNVSDNGRHGLNGPFLDPTELPLPETGETFLRVNALNAVRRVRAIFVGGGGGDLDSTAANATTVPTLGAGSSVNRRGRIGADGAIGIGPDDIDLFEVQLNSRGDISVALLQPAGGAAFTPTIRLFDAAGNQLARADGAGGLYPTFRTAQNQPLSPGTYYVGVSSLSNVNYSIMTGGGVGNGGSEGDYALTVSLNNPDFNGVAQGATTIDLTTPDTLAFASVISTARPGIIGADDPPPGAPVSAPRTIVDSGDVDMFRLVAPDDGTLWARTLSTLIPGAPVTDTYLRIFDENFNELAFHDDISPNPPINRDSEASTTVSAGETYYIGVTNFANRTFNPTDPYGRIPNSTPDQEPYSLFISFSNGDVDGTAVTAATRTIGTPVSEAISTDRGGSPIGSNNGNKDVDFNAFSAPADGLLDLSVTPVTPGFESVLALWEYNTTQHTIVKLGEAVGAAPRLIRQVATGNVLYASVTGRGNQSFNWFALASGPGGQTGSYTLNSALQPLTNLTTLSDGSIQLNTPTVLASGSTAIGSIGMDGNLLLNADVDLYSFTPSTGGRYDIRTDTAIEGSADTLLRLFDASGNPVALNDNAIATTTASALRVRLDAGVTYYVGVSSAGAGGATYDARTGAGAEAAGRGSYTLSVNPTPAGAPAVSVTDSAPARENFRGGGVVTFAVSLDAPATVPVTVGYVTSDGTAGGSDFTGGSGTVTFAPGETVKTFTVPITGDAAPEGDETFVVDIAVVDGAQAVIADERAVGTIQNQIVQPLAFSSALRQVITDASGDRVVITLRGPGSGEVLMLDETAGDPAAITLNGTTAASVLTITGDTTVGDITVNGSLRSLMGTRVDLVGNLLLAGGLNQLRVRNVGSGRAISIGAGGNLNATVGSVTDTRLISLSPIRSLRVARWLDTDATADLVSAPGIRSLTSLGDFGSDINAGSIGTMLVRGALAGSNVNVSGQIRSVRLGSASNSRVFAGVTGTALPDSADDFANSSASIGSFIVRGGQFSNTSIAAPTIGKVLLGSVQTSNNGTPFGIAADSLRSLTTPTLRLARATDPAASRTEADFVVRIV